MGGVVRVNLEHDTIVKTLIDILDGRIEPHDLRAIESRLTSCAIAVPMPTASHVSALNSAALCAVVATSLSHCGERVLALLHSLDRAKNSVTETLEEIQGTFTQRPKTRLKDGVRLPLPPHVPISTASTRRLAEAANSLDASIHQLASDIVEASTMLHQLRMMRERE
jgi:hypothetical protein